MSDQTDAIQTVLTDVDELLREKFRAAGMPDTPFVLVAVSPANEMIIRGNLDPVALKMLSEDLAEVADEATGLPTDGDPIH